MSNPEAIEALAWPELSVSLSRKIVVSHHDMEVRWGMWHICTYPPDPEAHKLDWKKLGF